MILTKDRHLYSSLVRPKKDLQEQLPHLELQNFPTKQLYQGLSEQQSSWVATIFGDARLARTRGYEGHCPIEIDINTKIVAPFQRFVSEGGVILTLGEARTKRIHKVAPPRSYGWII